MSDDLPIPAVPASGVVVASFRSASELRVALDALREERIEATPAPDTTLGSGWFCVSVAVDVAERALGVLRTVWPPERERVEEALPEHCPECGSLGVRAFSRWRFVLLAAALLLPAGALTGQHELFGLTFAIVSVVLLAVPNRRCTACGGRWQAGRRPPPREVAVETPDVPCPRCGSSETFAIDRRRRRAITLLVNLAIPPLIVLWPLLARRRCGECGHEWR